MNIQNTDFDSSYPNSFHYQPAATLGFPSVAEAYDRHFNSGSGIGRGTAVIKKAIGEYFERRHFYIEVTPDIEGHLAKDLTTKEAESFAKAFTQTSQENLDCKTLKDHTFQLTKAYRVKDFSPCHIPTTCISLSPLKSSDDNDIYPCRDTCGCCFHWSPEQSMLGAIKEFLERQFLLKFWLTQSCTKKSSNREILKKLKTHKAYNLGETLCKAGELVALDISPPDFPGKCILTIYGQKSSSQAVKYCAGLSYASSEAAALETSIGELWQTFRFMTLFTSINGDIEALHDPYLRHFLNCNSYKTFKTVKDCTINHASDAAPYAFDLHGLRKTLIDRKISGYFYTKFRVIGGNSCLFSKFISPDLFLHMNNSQNFNLNNIYSSKFKKEIMNNRISTMVPFP
ncbi:MULTISPECIES: YcaO-like family protein [Pseudomonas]|uniref:YcaO-like family protein n=1 Tax=Pseudomonas TaxID=286 RepID=UPI0023607E91|nr:YcaO-like family protein [Pseudomonas asplenii]